MALIYVIDDDYDVCEMVSDMVRSSEHDVESFQNPVTALEAMVKSPPRMIVSDINMPEMSGFELYQRVKKNPSLAKIPFLFLTAADEETEQELAKWMERGDVHVMLKPPRLRELRSRLAAMLEEKLHEQGALTAANLADLLHRINDSRAVGMLTVTREETVISDRLPKDLISESGSLTVHRYDTVKKLFFHEGQLAFALSNDPNDPLGTALIRSGLVEEKELGRVLAGLFDVQVHTGVAAVLSLFSDTPIAKIESIVSQHIREAALEMFLWTEGHYSFESDGDRTKPPFSVELSPAEIADEGRRRARIWPVLLERLPPPETRLLQSEPGVPDDVRRQPGLQRLCDLIDAGHTVGSLGVTLRGQEFAVAIHVVYWLGRQWVTRGPVRPSPTAADRGDMPVLTTDNWVKRLSGSGVGDPDDDAPELDSISQALTAFRRGDLWAARNMFEQVLRRNPDQLLARRRISEIDEAGEQAALRAGLEPDRELQLTVMSLGEFLKANTHVSSEAAFVLSRLADGPMSVQDVVDISPLDPAAVLMILHRYLDAGVIALG